jgi:hypothetical protein
MIAVDSYFLIAVGRFDRATTEQYLDQAERWLGTWRAGAVRAVTFGYVNPQSIVDAEVRKSLGIMGDMVSWTMRWVAIQVACRVAFGLTVWGSWFLLVR